MQTKAKGDVFGHHVMPSYDVLAWRGYVGARARRYAHACQPRCEPERSACDPRAAHMALHEFRPGAWERGPGVKLACTGIAGASTRSHSHLPDAPMLAANLHRAWPMADTLDHFAVRKLRRCQPGTDRGQDASRARYSVAVSGVILCVCEAKSKSTDLHIMRIYTCSLACAS